MKKDSDFRDDDRIIVIQHFWSESEAHLYVAHLKAAGIPCFLSDTNIMTALPLGGGGGIALHIREQDRIEAQRIISRLNFKGREQSQSATPDQTVTPNPPFSWRQQLLFLLVVLALLLLLRAFLRAAGWVERWPDGF